MRSNTYTIGSGSGTRLNFGTKDNPVYSSGTIIKFDNSQPSINISYPKRESVFKSMNLTNDNDEDEVQHIHLRGFQIDCNWKAAYGLNLKNVSYSKFEDLTIVHPFDNPSRLDHESAAIKIDQGFHNSFKNIYHFSCSITKFCIETGKEKSSEPYFYYDASGKFHIAVEQPGWWLQTNGKVYPFIQVNEELWEVTVGNTFYSLNAKKGEVKINSNLESYPLVGTTYKDIEIGKDYDNVKWHYDGFYTKYGFWIKGIANCNQFHNCITKGSKTGFFLDSTLESESDPGNNVFIGCVSEPARVAFKIESERNIVIGHYVGGCIRGFEFTDNGEKNLILGTTYFSQGAGSPDWIRGEPSMIVAKNAFFEPMLNFFVTGPKASEPKPSEPKKSDNHYLNTALFNNAEIIGATGKFYHKLKIPVTTNTRPSVKRSGYMVFDQELGIPLWWNKKKKVWVDAFGNEK